MSNKSQYVSRDLVADAIARPIEWGRLEELANAVLVADDFPTLRKIGGISDQGIDSLEEVFYDGQRKISTVVQVTSAHGQRAKVRDTIKKLRDNKIEFSTLVFLTRHPVSSETRREIIERAEEDGVTIDIRDDQYLIAQLSKDGVIFSRFYGTTAEQLDALLSRPDPLRSTDGRTQRALLASLGAFVLSKRAKIARGTLADKTVLAVLAEKGGQATVERIADFVHELLPNENRDVAQVQASIDRLCSYGSCRIEGKTVVCDERVMTRFLEVSQKTEKGYRTLVDYVTEHCRRVSKLDDAQAGYVERNIRRALLGMFRISGPINADENVTLSGEDPASFAIATVMASDLPADLGRAALAAFSTFAANPKQAALLAPLVRSYSALAIRNIDPLGRRWQQNVLSRNCIALDTDALLFVLIEELPEHRPVLEALRALQAQKVEIVVPEHVLEEAISHIGRSRKTFSRFASSLLRLPAAVVDARVWHAIVRGYYYASKRGNPGKAEDYGAKYYDSENPRQYVEYLLSKRLKLKLSMLNEPPEGSEEVLVHLQEAILEYRERNRKKAAFRGASEMAARVRADVSMALHLAAKASDDFDAQARGYLASSDRAYRLIEKHSQWPPRKSFLVHTEALPELASFICATSLSDDEAVSLLFHPASVAAADIMAGEITVLASIGVDLKDAPLDRLDWDLQHSLRGSIDDLGEAIGEAKVVDDPASTRATLNVAKEAQTSGYDLIAPVELLIRSYDAMVQQASVERQMRVDIEEKMKALVDAARQTTKKGRTRINRIARELGIEIETADVPDEDDD